jgi:DNA invertase Pin-like site-specific DNA recombinase
MQNITNYLEDLDMKDIDDRVEDTVQEVISHKVVDGVWSFLIQFSDGETQWVKDEDCDCENQIKEYLEKHRLPTHYCISRVSTKPQRDGEVSLSTQKHNLSTFAKSTNYIRVKHIEITGSAFRCIPAKLRAVVNASTKGDAIIVYRIDRLGRNVTKFLALLENMEKKGVTVYSIHERLWYHENKMEFVEKLIQSNKESITIGDRVKMSVEQRRRRGDECLGSARYGYKLCKRDGKVVLDTINNEQDIINIIKKLNAEFRSPKFIAKYLNENNHLKRGRKWTHVMVKYMLKTIKLN